MTTLETDYAIARQRVHGDAELGDRHAGEAKQMLKGLLGRMALGGVLVGRDVRTMRDGTVVEVHVNGPVRNIDITTPGGEHEVTPRPITATTVVPDFYSGVVVDDGAGFHPTTTTVTPRTGIDLGRLDMPQYRDVRPTMFTGKMCRVVQAIMGFGKLESYNSLYSATYRGKTSPADPFGEKFKAKYQTPRLKRPNYERSAIAGGRAVQYRHSWSETDGIHTANDGHLWLVRISKHEGVLAMPLPLIESTTTTEFRRFLNHVPYAGSESTYVDIPAIRMVEAFGGFPSGVSFPTSNLQEYIDAGVVLRLASKSELTEFGGFYADSNQPVGSEDVCWAFSEDGHAADNIAGQRYLRGLWQIEHHRVSINMGNVVTPPTITPDKLALRDMLTGPPGNNQNYIVMALKAFRATDRQVAQWLDFANAQSAFPSMQSRLYQRIRDASVPAMATGSVTFRKLDEARATIKTGLDGVVFGDTELSQPNRYYYPDGQPFDVPIFVWYEDNTLRQLRMAYDGPDEDVVTTGTPAHITLPGPLVTQHKKQKQYYPFLYIDEKPNQDDGVSIEERDQSLLVTQTGTVPGMTLYNGATHYSGFGTFQVVRDIMLKYKWHEFVTVDTHKSYRADMAEGDRSSVFLCVTERKNYEKTWDHVTYGGVLDPIRYKGPMEPTIPLHEVYYPVSDSTNMFGSWIPTSYALETSSWLTTYSQDDLDNHDWPLPWSWNWEGQCGYSGVGEEPPWFMVWNGHYVVGESPTPQPEHEEETSDKDVGVDLHANHHGVITVLEGGETDIPKWKERDGKMYVARNAFGPSAAIAYSREPDGDKHNVAYTGSPTYSDMTLPGTVFIGYVE